MTTQLDRIENMLKVIVQSISTVRFSDTDTTHGEALRSEVERYLQTPQDSDTPP